MKCEYCEKRDVKKIVQQGDKGINICNRCFKEMYQNERRKPKEYIKSK